METFVPRPHQEIIIREALRIDRGAIWSFMGSGKTSATLEVLDILRLAGCGKALVVAPLRVARDVWPDEVKKWGNLSHLHIVAITGTREERERALRRDADIYTINFNNLPWLIKELDGSWPFETVVVDESSRLKAFRGGFRKHPKSGKVYFQRGGGVTSCFLGKNAHRAKRFIELTGTPSSNGLQDLWPQIWFLDFGQRLGSSFDAFSRRWFEKSYDGFSLTPRDYAHDEIVSRVSDIVCSIRSEDWFPVEEPIVRDVIVDLPPGAWRQYETMRKDLYVEIESVGIEAVSAGARDGKLGQMANGCVYAPDGKTHVVVHSEKLNALESIIEECAGAPVLIVYQYKHDVVEIRKRFKDFRVLDSKTKGVDKAWNAGKIPGLLIHGASGGHGLNLQDGGNIIIYYGVGWDLELMEQVLERIGPVRQKQSGYNRNVFVYYIMARGTIDEVKRERLKSKRSVQEAILNHVRKK